MMKVGSTLEISKKITDADIQKLIEISGDDNPLHTDEEFAKKTIFRGRIAHGILSAALVSAALTRMFGPGNLWMSQTIKYTYPVRINDTITAKLRITAIDKRKVATVETLVFNQDGKVVLEGIAESRVMHVKSK
jgi:3-hydroxybutyryl-CoA dehydratase